MTYESYLNDNQRALLRCIFPPAVKRLIKHEPLDVLEAIFFIVYTGCQWSKLSRGYPNHKTVYYHYRRLMRNYEQHLSTATHMTVLAMVFFMLRYFA